MNHTSTLTNLVQWVSKPFSPLLRCRLYLSVADHKLFQIIVALCDFVQQLLALSITARELDPLQDVFWRPSGRLMTGEESV